MSIVKAKLITMPLGRSEQEKKPKFIELSGDSKEPDNGSLVGWDFKGKDNVLSL